MDRAEPAQTRHARHVIGLADHGTLGKRAHHQRMPAILERFWKLPRVLRAELHLIHEDQRVLRRNESQERGGKPSRHGAHLVQEIRACRRVIRRFGERRQKSGNPPIVTGDIRSGN